MQQKSARAAIESEMSSYTSNTKKKSKQRRKEKGTEKDSSLSPTQNLMQQQQIFPYSARAIDEISYSSLYNSKRNHSNKKRRCEYLTQRSSYKNY